MDIKNLKCENCKFWSQNGHLDISGQSLDMDMKMAMSGICDKMNDPLDSIQSALIEVRLKYSKRAILRSKNGGQILYATKYDYGCNRFEKDEFEQDKCQKPAPK